jgi:hypothetical protein
MEKKRTLRYPLNYDSKNNNYDYLNITVARYVPSLKSSTSFNNISTASFTVPSVISRLKEVERGVTVYLPMYPGITESNNVDWGGDELNPIQAGLGKFAQNAILNLGSGNVGQAAQQGMTDIQQLLSELQGGPLYNFVASYFAGQAVGANLVTRSTGMVINPNLELLFKGPKLRSFKYSYRFTPRDREEALEVRRIIKLFKREMAVQKSSDNLFLKTPNIFLLKYIYKGNNSNDHPFLNKIKPCALTGFNVNYTPDGTYMTYNDTEKADGSMTSYLIDMQFDELEPIYRDDYTDTLDDPTMGY